MSPPPSAHGTSERHLERLRHIGGGPLTPRDRLDVQAVLDCLPYYVMLVDADHHIVLANEAVREALAVAPEAIVGGYCPRVVHGVEGPYPGCPLEDAVAGGGCAVECDLFEDDGRIYKSAIYPTPYKTESGLDVFLHTTQDITDQRRAEERERRSLESQRAVNELLRVALEPLPLDDVLSWVLDIAASISWLAFLPKGAIFVFDPLSDDLVMRASVGLDNAVREACARVPSGTCLCGRAAANRETVFSSGSDEHHLVDHGRLASHGHYCVPIVQQDNVLGILNVYVREGHQPTSGEREFLNAVASVLAGIIQRQRAEALRRTHERIALSRGRMARVGELAAGVAHAIRNPLHGLLNSIEIFQSRVSPEDAVATQILPLMREALERIERVTRRLLSLTRDVKVAPRSTDVGALLAEVQRLVAGHADQKGVALAFEKSDLPEVVLDPERVGEALANVIGNAIDASGPGDVVTVRARFEADPSPTVIVEVEDDGEGIAADDLPRILDPFFTTKPVGEGSGLGLAITRQVMEEHDGTVEVQSELGKGTLVRLSFPRPLDVPR